MSRHSDAQDFVRQMRALGRTDKEIRTALRNAGWTNPAIDALLQSEAPLAPSGPFDAPHGPGSLASGFHNNSGTCQEPPPEVARMRWSWGAFSLTWIWGLANNVYISLLQLGWGILFGICTVFQASGSGPLSLLGAVGAIGTGLAAFGFPIWLGLNGHSLAWKNRRFTSFEHFQATMRAWNLWGIGILVASAVIAIPAGIMGGLVAEEAMQQVLAGSRAEACQSNLKQLALGALMFAADYDGYLPDARVWADAIVPYIKNTELFYCPAGGLYAMNPRLSLVNLGAVPAPSQTVLLYEVDENGAVAFRHAGLTNIAFADGHVKLCSRAEAEACFW